ncbi:hypothetical protein K438DRAFT_2113698 [Mycena galopus ATCC 62051]|nr:hypothetical protein K438DRAFT_2113698 [Mycena galopus ATCC 62051]
MARVERSYMKLPVCTPSHVSSLTYDRLHDGFMPYMDHQLCRFTLWDSSTLTINTTLCAEANVPSNTFAKTCTAAGQRPSTSLREYTWTNPPSTGGRNAVISGTVALAATRKHLVKSSAWVPKQNIENSLCGFGRPPTEPVAVIIGEAETWEQYKWFIANAEFQKYIQDLMKGILVERPERLQQSSNCGDPLSHMQEHSILTPCTEFRLKGSFTQILHRKDRFTYNSSASRAAEEHDTPSPRDIIDIAQKSAKAVSTAYVVPTGSRSVSTEHHDHCDLPTEIVSHERYSIEQS